MEHLGFDNLVEVIVCNSWRAGGQQEGLQYNGKAAG